MCKSWCEAILAVIIIVFGLWNIPIYSKWVVVIAGIVLLIHSFTCKKCFAGHGMGMSAGSSRKKR